MPQPLFENFLNKLTELEQKVSELPAPEDRHSQFFVIKRLVSSTLETLRRLMNKDGWTVGFMELIQQAKGQHGFSNQLKSGLMDPTGKNLVINDAETSALVQVLYDFLNNPLPIEKKFPVRGRLYTYATTTERDRRHKRQIQLQDILTAYNKAEREKNDPMSIRLAPLNYGGNDKKFINELETMSRFDIGDPTQEKHLEQAIARAKERIPPIKSELVANIARNQQIIIRLERSISDLKIESALTHRKLDDVRQRLQKKSFKFDPDLAQLLPIELSRTWKFWHNYSNPLKKYAFYMIAFAIGHSIPPIPSSHELPQVFTTIIAKLESEQTIRAEKLATATSLITEANTQIQQATTILQRIESLEAMHCQRVAAQLVTKLEDYAATEQRFLSGFRHFIRSICDTEELHTEKTTIARKTAQQIKAVLDRTNENSDDKHLNQQLKTAILEKLTQSLEDNEDAECRHRQKPKGWFSNELAGILSTGQKHLLLAQDTKPQTPRTIPVPPTAAAVASPHSPR